MENPEMFTGDCGWMESKPVLGFYYGDRWIIVKLEQVDEDCPAKWVTCDSERWAMDAPVYWQELPEFPKIKA